MATSSSLDSRSGILAPPVSTSLLGTFGPQFAGIESFTLALVALITGLRNARTDDAASGDGETSLAFATDIEEVKVLDG